MKKALVLGALALALAPQAAHAAQSVGLGVGAGVAVPHGQALRTDAALNWGFHVDIPILDSFAISPSMYLYRVNGASATDVSVNFKFVIPLGRLDLYGGVTAGLTNIDRIEPHVGALAGVELVLVSNLDVFVQASYRTMLQEGDDTRDLMVFAGPVFRF
ncbi:MAG: hypothetical protein RIT81_41190 [Deltaproteobacteria bacterium]